MDKCELSNLPAQGQAQISNESAQVGSGCVEINFECDNTNDKLQELRGAFKRELEPRLTLKQIEDMKHCIGLDYKKPKRGKYEAYRNYYTTSSRSQSWDELVDFGLATRREIPKELSGWDDPQCYLLTLQGLEFLGKLLGCKITEME